MTNVSTYKRGQVVWALWQCFSHRHSPDPNVTAVPKAFATRVRKMGEFGVPLAEEEKPGQPGIDIEYSAYHAFELGVALTMQDTGLKQAEVAFFIRNIRPDLRECFDRIMRSPPMNGQSIFAKDRPLSPNKIVIDGADPKKLGNPHRAHMADTSAFMTFRYVEIREAWGNLNFDDSDWAGKSDTPFFFTPKFHFGLGGLMEEMDWIGGAAQDNVRIVLELSNLAGMLTMRLSEAPVMRRGRP